MRRIAFLMWKELIELRTDPRLLVIAVVMPIVQLMILAYATTTDIRNVPLVVVDADRSAASRELVSRFDGSPTFTIVGVLSSARDVDPLLERGDAWLSVVIPQGYASALAAGRPQAVQILADGSDANSSGVSIGYATNLIAAYNQELAARTPPSAAGAAPVGGLAPVVRVWFNPRLESRDFMIPGIVAILLLVVTTNLSSMAIVREKELGTLEQLNVTPLTRTELIIGKLLPYGLVGMVDVVLVLAVAILWFQVPMHGSYVLLLATTLIYLVSTLGLGLFVSTISGTQQQAMMTSTFFFLMPMMLLSGFVFPIENMPALVQPVTYLIPLRYFLVILRAIFLKGTGLETLWPQVLALSAWSAGILLLAIARSSRRLS